MWQKFRVKKKYITSEKKKKTKQIEIPDLYYSDNVIFFSTCVTTTVGFNNV